VIDIGCGDKFMVVLAANFNFKGPNQNLKYFQSQNKLLLEGKWQNLIDFSHKKAVYINNLENMRKETLMDISPKMNTLKTLKSLKKNEPLSVSLKFKQESHKEIITKKQLIEKSYHLLMELEENEKETLKKESKNYAKGIQNDHKEHKRRSSNSTKKVLNHRIESLCALDIQEENLLEIKTLPELYLKSTI